MAEQQQYENNKKELLDSYFTIRKLQERVNRLEEENQNLQIERDDIKNYFGIKKEKYEDMIDLQRTEIEQLKNEKQRAEYENEKSKRELIELKEEVQEQLEDQKKEFERERSDLLDRIQILQQKLDNLETFVRQKAELEADRRNLREQLEIEKRLKQDELAIKEEEKIKATDKLKKICFIKFKRLKHHYWPQKKNNFKQPRDQLFYKIIN
ncbi:hypothetical protein IMG5_076310 [Ichthyophthirius multifiliis]|uniref:Uncharacterized protein n=1 Tax=Ichthyophthirius multifiliis TaxID=5932 RepID=G0QQA0_ICHMU|nr:hypothetical protein IMG5_076310 [Ichthyophthirius multifiliis]EGR32601.1 hypothetical protein IMG5_076310 [Ichthyophthirius multifiliis]|eukprot:XP_004036587.1 hypothetical protein IMG5_076310 [Ichthyophthirius multifiliis]